MVVGGVAAGVGSPEVANALSALAGISACLALVGGLVRLVRQHGVTLQAVAGALAIYLQLGLIFAWVIGFIAYVDTVPFFAEDFDGRRRSRLLGFTVLTTTASVI